MKPKIAVVSMMLYCLPVASAGDNIVVRTDYHKQALLLQTRLRQDELPTTLAVIEKTLRVIDLKLKVFFPYEPFDRNDMIALAWLESGFHQYEGGTHGERGLFQIMPDEFVQWHITKDFYDIDMNTTMALRVLRYKQRKWHSAKRTIQAYNGIVRYKDGRISERYWRAFMKRKIAVKELLEDK